jgi:YidC/Oxa1 family membrane protein insertase
MAEQHQRSERDIQKHMKPEVDNIKAVFSGDERFMRLAVYYRQNGYHPLYSLRSSISLIIQIPFFIAAYHFLFNLGTIKNVSFGPIMDLAKPDALLSANNFSINILPIVMTLINCISAMLYTKGFSVKDKIQLYGMAALFLILLYNSPSGMVLYWTGNNLFSLVKNLIQKTKKPKRITHIIVSVFCFLLLPYLLFIHDGWIVKRILIAFIFACIPFIPFFISFFSRKIQTLSFFSESRGKTGNTDVFLLSMFILFLLGALVIPSSLIASSVTEFSFIEDYKSPIPFILHAVLQSFGIFLLWPVCVYCLFPESTKTKIAKLMAVITGIVVIDTVLFPGKYGHMSILFIISDNFKPIILLYLLNLLVVIIAVVLILLLVNRFRKIMVTVMAITACAFVILSSINNIKIYREFKSLQLRVQSLQSQPQEYIYNFSTEGRNVLVIMLDRGISAFIPYIFEEKPELYKSFDGFTWYKNTISFGSNTILGSPGLFGGYEYTPLEMQRRNDVSLVDKHNEALLLLPRIFLEHSFMVTVTDPPFANYEWIPDLSIFSNYPQMKAENIEGKYTDQWLKDKGDVISNGKLINLIKINLIRFSFFKFVPLLFRNFVYDNGSWLAVDAEITKIFPHLTLNSYVLLDSLPKITKINKDGADNYNVITNTLPHEPHLLQAPEYIPVGITTDTGNGPFANNKAYHVNNASILLHGT